MKDKLKYRLLLAGLSPWIILGAVLVLLPIIALMTLENINRQKQQSIHLMMEKGAALIRSFEAGTRMGMRGGHGSGFQLQRLLVETAAQPDIAYLLVVRINGTVIAHSQMDRVGTEYGEDLNLDAVYGSGILEWRRLISANGERVFEIFGKFAPLGKMPMGPRHSHMMGGMPMPPPGRSAPPMVIFVGLRTDAVDAARAADTRHTVVMAAVLLLVGCTGVLLLFLAQNYRTAQISLVRVKAFSDNLVARMPIGLVALDRDGRINALNSVAASTLAIDAVHTIGQPADAVIPAVLTDTLADAHEVVEKELLCPLADGRHIPMDVSAASLSGEDGECFGQVILFKDLSEIRALRHEVEKNRRLASVGRLAAGVAHEIRNPLSSIKGFTIMIQEVDRLNRVVGQLLEFSRPVQLHFQTVSLKPFLEDVFRLIRRQSDEADVATTLKMADDRIEATMDTDKMSQVLLNLYLNALDAMAAGGQLTVSVSQEETDRILIQVSDTGSGIDRKDLPYIFEPYFSTKKSGTGLGLAIVHNIVKAHEGDIQVDSRPGKGTAIQITLPAAKEA
ncbi:MAG: PAS domain-containing protein [Desulfosarcina sp.]|nr:PAS domain-containing protein [Desulfosarcina sp.]